MTRAPYATVVLTIASFEPLQWYAKAKQETVSHDPRLRYGKRDDEDVRHDRLVEHRVQSL